MGRRIDVVASFLTCRFGDDNIGKLADKPMLDLADTRWSDLSTHDGDAAWVPEWLERLEANPDDRKLLDDGRWRLWSDENTWSASFAAAPYLVGIATMARPDVKIEYVKLLGLMAMYRTRPGWQGEYLACPPDLEKDFEQALGQASILAAGLSRRRFPAV